jgi:hypothetical protein
MPAKALAVVSAVSTGVSVVSGVMGAQQQKKAAKAQQRQAELKNAREKRDAIRQYRVAAAMALQGAENQGAASTSASMGGLGSIQSQLTDNMSFLDQYGTLSDQASGALGKAAQLNSVSDFGTAIGSLSWKGATSLDPDLGTKIKKIFKQ